MEPLSLAQRLMTPLRDERDRQASCGSWMSADIWREAGADTSRPISTKKRMVNAMTEEISDRGDDGKAHRETLQFQYEEICKSHLAITDFRGKLLELLPLAAGTGIFLLLDNSANIKISLLAAVGVFGVLVTIGLYFYEHRGMNECILLRKRGAKLECRLQITEDCAQFQANTPGFVGPQGAGPIIYFAVVAGWLFVAFYGFVKSGHMILVGSLIIAAYLNALLIAFFTSRCRNEAERQEKSCRQEGQSQ